MATHVALLRAVNVGGTRKLPMADLRAVVESLGHRDVRTYVQSGNVVFTAASPEAAVDELGAQITAAIEGAVGFAPPTLVLASEDLEAIAEANPYIEQAAQAPKEVHALLLPEAPGPAGQEDLAGALERVAAKGSNDHATLIDRTIYLFTPGGIGRSALGPALTASKRALGAAGTARNWSTVTQLLTLMRD